MQVFYAFPGSFAKTIAILDDKRLVKQILECYTMLSGKWKNHPASLSWGAYELESYGTMACAEYEKRFGKHHVYKTEFKVNKAHTSRSGVDIMIVSHRINLLRKDYTYYNRFFKCRNFALSDFPLGYYWPVRIQGGKADSDSKQWEQFCARLCGNTTVSLVNYLTITM